MAVIEPPLEFFPLLPTFKEERSGQALAGGPGSLGGLNARASNGEEQFFLPLLGPPGPFAPLKPPPPVRYSLDHLWVFSDICHVF